MTVINLLDAFCIVLDFCFFVLKSYVQFCSIHQRSCSIFGFVMLHIACGGLTDSLIFPLFQYCMMDWYLQEVSPHDILTLRLSVVNLLIAFVLFRSFAFEKFMLCMFAF